MTGKRHSKMKDYHVIYIREENIYSGRELFSSYSVLLCYDWLP